MDYRKLNKFIDKTSLLEATRTQLLSKSKSSPKGKERLARKNKSRVATSVKQYNSIDMNKLFKDNILTVNIQVKGETADYVVRVSFGGFLDFLNRELRNDKPLDLRAITRALVNGFNQDNVYIHCSCPDFCLQGDTKIKLLSGESIPIKELVKRVESGEEVWVYSVDDKGDFKPGKLTDAWISGYVDELIKVTLDNGESILTTNTHRYMLRDGNFEEAQNLVPGQSLMPLYFKYESGYENVKINSTVYPTMFVSVYKIVANELLQGLIEKAKVRSGEDIIHIHHKDFNKLNNTPNNLLPLGAHEHWMYHANHVKESGCFDKFRAAGEEYWKTDAAKAKQADVMRKAAVEFWGSHDHKQVIAERRKQGMYGDDWKQKISDSNTLVWENYTEEEYLNRCAINKETNSRPETKEKQSIARKEWYKNHPEHIEKRRQNIKIAQEACIGLPKTEATKKKMSLARLNEDPEHMRVRNLHIRDTKLKKVIDKVLSSGEVLTFESFDRNRGRGCPKLSKYFTTIEDVKDYFGLNDLYNHKVISVEKIHLSKEEPVYDITVDKYNNFLVDAGVILHNCYRFHYWSTRNDFNSGEPQTSNGKWIRNPDDKLGSACKHVLLVLSNNSWLLKVASVINNYIKYVQEHMEKAYADIIYPAIYKKKYEGPVQTSVFDQDELETDSETIDVSNEMGRTRGQFKQGNEYRFRPSTTSKNQLSIDEVEAEN